MEERIKREPDWEDHFAAMVKSLRRDFKDKEMEWSGKEFVRHARAARREMLLAFRSLLDDAIERIEKQNATEPKASRIVVE
jgi:hypothetical protein